MRLVVKVGNSFQRLLSFKATIEGKGEKFKETNIIFLAIHHLISIIKEYHDDIC